MRYGSYDGDAADLLESLHTSAEPFDVPADVVEDDPFDPGSVGFGYELYCSQRICECTAPFDIDHQDDVGIGYHGRTHVGDVLVVDVDLGRGSGTLHYDVVVSLLEEVYVVSDNAPARPGNELVVVRFDIAFRKL